MIESKLKKYSVNQYVVQYEQMKWTTKSVKFLTFWTAEMLVSAAWLCDMSEHSHSHRYTHTHTHLYDITHLYMILMVMVMVNVDLYSASSQKSLMRWNAPFCQRQTDRQTDGETDWSQHRLMPFTPSVMVHNKAENDWRDGQRIGKWDCIVNSANYH